MRESTVQPSIDILMATYNGGSYLEAQLDSIFSQTVQSFTLYVRDDQSNDNTSEILNRYSEKFGPRMKVLNDGLGRLGVIRNFFTLLGGSNAEYVMLCDQDDVWLPRKIEITLAKMQEIEFRSGKHTPVLVHTDLKVVSKELEILGDSLWQYQNLDPAKDSLSRLVVHNVVTGCTAMINRSHADLTLSALPEHVMMHDWWFALVATCFGKIDFVTEQTMLYRQHGKNDTGAKKWSASTLLKKLSTYSETSKLLLRKTQAQAGEFSLRFQAKLTAEQIQLLNTYSEMDKLSGLGKRLFLIRNSIFKQGVLRTFAMLAFI